MADEQAVVSDDHAQAVAAAFSRAEGAGQAAAPQPAEPVQAQEPAEQGQPAAGPTRDEAGRFKPREAPAGTPAQPAEAKAPAEPATEGEQAKEEPPPTPPPTKYRAPASWSEEERELWSKVPPEAQRAIARREAAIVAGLKEAAPARELASAFQQVTQPFAAMFQAEGVQPLAAVQSLLQQAAVMRVGEPAVKAKVMAGWIRQFGVPIQALAAELDGKGAAPQAPGYQPQQPQAPMPYQYPGMQHAPGMPGMYQPAMPYGIMAPGMNPAAQQHPALQAAQAELQELRRAQYAGEIAALQKEAEFLDYPVGEFLAGADGQPVEKTIRDEMADYIEWHTQNRTKPIGLKEAYDFVLSQHPELVAAKRQKEAAKAAKANAEKARRAQEAGSSVTSSRPPGGAGVSPKVETPEDAVTLAFARYADQR